MPGFTVNAFNGAVGGNVTGVPSSARYYYTYTWEIVDLFQEAVIREDRNVLVHLKDLTLPTFNVSKEVVIGSALEYKFGKSVSWSDVKVVWYDTVGLISVIRRWRERVWNQSSGLAPAGEYKRRSILSQYSPYRTELNDAETVQYRLEGSWPSIIRYGDLTYTNSDVKVIEVTISYDWAEEEGPAVQ